MDLVILNHGQVTWTTPEPAPLHSSNFHTPLTGGYSSLDRFNAHHLPTRRVFGGTRLELMTRQTRVLYLHPVAHIRKDPRSGPPAPPHSP
ncbi:hypothetical protein TNCV_3359551 [Trichonephila clavipes]|nr:hypothetical protein TNCV_3359551 [Trichonephila clavipes]